MSNELIAQGNPDEFTFTNAAATDDNNAADGRPWEFGPVVILGLAVYSTSTDIDNIRVAVGTETINVPRINQANPLELRNELLGLARGIPTGRRVQLLIDNANAGTVDVVVVVVWRYPTPSERMFIDSQAGAL